MIRWWYEPLSRLRMATSLWRCGCGERFAKGERPDPGARPPASRRQGGSTKICGVKRRWQPRSGARFAGSMTRNYAGSPDRGVARPTDPSRPYPGTERPELPPQPQPRAQQGLDDLICASPPAGNCARATPSLRFRLTPPPASSRPPRTISPEGRGGSVLLRPLVWFLSALDSDLPSQIGAPGRSAAGTDRADPVFQPSNGMLTNANWFPKRPGSIRFRRGRDD